MEPSKLNTGLDTLERSVCLRLISNETVGRLGVIIDGRPEVYPVNFVVVAGEDILIHTDQGRKLAAAVGGPVVFEVDHLDATTRTGWSVMVHGTAHLTSGHEVRAGSQNGVLRPWRNADLPHQLRIGMATVTGRRINLPVRVGS